MHAGLGAVGGDAGEVADERLGGAVVRRRQLLHHVAHSGEADVLVLGHGSLRGNKQGIRKSKLCRLYPP